MIPALYLLMMMSLAFDTTSECDIKQFYSATSLSSGTKALTTSGDLEEVEYLLSPTKIDEGNYEGYAKKKASDIYQIDNTKIFIETRYCYEYSADVIIKIESNYGLTRGKLIFD